MTRENATDSNALSARSRRLVSYSFDSLTQRHTVHLLDHKCAQQAGPATQEACILKSNEPLTQSMPRMGKFLLVGFLLGVLGFFVTMGLQRDFIAEATAMLQAFTPKQASVAPVRFEIPVGPKESLPSPIIPETAASPPNAEEKQGLPAYAPVGQAAPEKVTEGCTGARLAFSLCAFKE